jgi:hypothetical protein
MKNDFREFYDEDYIMHSYLSYTSGTKFRHGGGRKWQKHKYLYIDKNGNYVYPEDIAVRVKTKANHVVNAVKDKVSKAFKPDDPLTKMQKQYRKSMKKSAVKEFGRNVGNSVKQLGSDLYEESPGVQKFNKKAKSAKKKAGFVTGMIGKDINRKINSYKESNNRSKNIRDIEKFLNNNAATNEWNKAKSKKKKKSSHRG